MVCSYSLFLGASIGPDASSSVTGVCSGTVEFCLALGRIIIYEQGTGSFAMLVALTPLSYVYPEPIVHQGQHSTGVVRGPHCCVLPAAEADSAQECFNQPLVMLDADCISSLRDQSVIFFSHWDVLDASSKGRYGNGGFCFGFFLP